MGKWKYHLNESGERLRELTEGDESLENCAATLEQLRVCCQDVMRFLMGDEKDIYYSRFEELHDLIDNEPETLRERPEEIFAWEFSDAVELVNSRLAQFYDLCDAARVWIAMPKWD